MLKIELPQFLIIWQFLRRTNREMPRQMSASVAGGSFVNNSVVINFETASEVFRIEIFYNYIRVFKKLKLRLLVPINKIIVERLPWGENVDIQAGDPDNLLSTPKKWEFKALFGTVLLI